ncbi:RNA-processing protein, HAT helix [Corchorus olitorius]|uniref:RNA-processing protein, HAT helix n=1 Tax=Corchorus olitorius TaxID=93759 RepID=A0A1R3IJU9_9ROSI|nr:RNA-processing protein, HAT helix [Corchorus olitorius]
MEVGILTTETSETESRPGEGDSLESFDELKLKEFIAEGNLDFDGWTSLIAEVESLCADEVDKICLVYDSFLSEFPLCYGYWRKYAEHMIRLCTEEKAVEVFERAVQSATYSVGVWVDYCGFAISVFEDADDVRRLFKRAMSFVGKDYLCHTLWDKYVEFEFSQQEWSNLAHVYIQTLRFPSKKLHRYYESFQKLVATWKEDMPGLNDLDLQSDCKADHEGSTCYTDDEISCVIKDLLNPSTGVDVTNALEKYFSIGKVFYKEASQLDENIHRFESSIKRPYFHVKPLDISQLENWHDYLNFIEMHSDFDWAVKLYERCLIPCANYPEFWMRYVDYMESKGGRELANFALARATQIFLKRMPVIHLFSARFKEKIRDVSGAHEALLGYETESDLSFVETVSIRANMEKRLGNFVAASNTYKEAVEIATAKEKFDVLPMLYVNFSRLQYMITNNSDAARDILIEGIKRVPHCKLLLEELIKFGMMHGGSRDIHVLDAIINDVISLGLSQDLVTCSPRSYSSMPVAVSMATVFWSLAWHNQFVDLCGTLDDIRKAWKRHMKSFPDSARTSTNSVTGIKPIPNLKMTAGGRQGSLGALPSDPSGDGSFDIPTRSPPLDKVMKSLENDDTQPNNAASDCVSDKKSPLQENHEIPSDQATFNRLQSGEAESLQGEMEHRSQAVSEQLREDVKANTGMSSPDSMQEVTNEVEVLPTSEENSKESDVQKEPDHKSEQDLNHLSLERLSLDHNKSLDCDRVTNQEGETIIDTSLSNESMGKSEPQETGMFDESVPEVGQSNDGDHLVSSPRSGRASDSAGIQTEMASPSSSVNQTNIKKTESVSRRSPPYGCRSWHQRSNADRGHRDNKFGFRRHSHKRMHQRRQFSPQRQYPQNETGTQVPMNQGYPSQSMSSQSPQVQQGGLTQNQYSASAAHPNSMAANAWSMQNMQQQSFDPSQSQFLPLPAYPQPQISPQPMQSNQQLGEMQNNQAAKINCRIELMQLKLQFPRNDLLQANDIAP